MKYTKYFFLFYFWVFRSLPWIMNHQLHNIASKVQLLFSIQVLISYLLLFCVPNQFYLFLFFYWYKCIACDCFNLCYQNRCEFLLNTVFMTQFLSPVLLGKRNFQQISKNRYKSLIGHFFSWGLFKHLF